MKVYEKPKLMVLSISANDALCGGCQKATRGDDFWNEYDPDSSDGVFTQDEAKSIGAFGQSETGCMLEFVGYCKFLGASNGDTQVFTS